MPSTKKSNLKELHLASSMRELNLLADPKISADKNANTNLYCNSADKVFFKATDFDLANDEENAFVFYMRYFNIISLIKNTTKYKQDKSHFDKLIGANKPIKAIERAEKLQRSLAKRYEEAQKRKEDEELAKRLLQEKEKEEAKAKAEKTNKSSTDDDLDDLLDNSGINSSSELFQRLKVSHSSVLKPESTTSSNGNGVTVFETPSPLLPGMGVAIPCVSSEELYRLIKTEDSNCMLIIDIRPRAEYTKNHILHSSCINVPAEMLEHGVSVSNIERRLAEKTRLMWRQRGSKQYVIILDKSTKVSEVSAQSLIQQLKDAIYKYDTHCLLSKEPLFLDGGFDSWLWHYPSMATISELPQISSSIDLPGITDLSALDYPELPEEKENRPTPSPVADTKTEPPNIENVTPSVGDISNENRVYPSILDTTAGIAGKRERNSEHTAPGNHTQVYSNGPTVREQDIAMPPVVINQAAFPNTAIPEKLPGIPAAPAIAPSPSITSTMPPPQPVNSFNTKPGEQPVVPDNTNRPLNVAVAPQGTLQGPYMPLVADRNTTPPAPGIVSSVPGQVPQMPDLALSQPPSVRQNSGNPVTSVPGVGAQLSRPSSGQQSTASSHGNSQITANPPTSVGGQPVLPNGPSKVSTDSNLPTVRGSDKSTVYAELVFPDKNNLPAAAPVKPPSSVSPGGDAVSLPNTPSQGIPAQSQSTKGSGYVTTGGLPPGWEKCVDQKTGRIFYRDHNTKTTHWKPPPLPTGGMGVAQRNIQQQPQAPPTVPQQRVTPASTQQQASGARQVPGVVQSTVTPPSTPAAVSMNLVTPTVNTAAVSPPQKQMPPGTQPIQQPKADLPPSAPSSSTHLAPQTSKLLTPSRLDQPKSSLRRSLSSPNLAQLDEPINKAPSRPIIDRSSKPAERPTFNRNSKPITTFKLESLNPVSGGVGNGLTGLRNLGNTCYMNSVLQCLFSTSPLAAYFVSGAFRDDLNKENPLGTRGELAEQFSFLVRATNSGRYKSISPSDFKRTVGAIKSSFAGYDQQDSQEFLALMMDKLHEDVNRIRQKPYLKAPEDDIDPSLAAEITWDNHKKRNESIMLNLFDGMFKSTVCCLTCKKESVTFETFSNLTLPLPSNRGHCSLQDCITLFTRPERMYGDDKWYCPRCKQHRDASKQLQIWHLPPILVIHLKRFQYDGMWRQKLQTAVGFPSQNLDISGYVIGPKPPRSAYHLYGVSNHYGTMHGGHYTAFCKNSHNKRWYKFDDQIVSEMSPKDAVTSAAYLLFYSSFEFTPPKLIY